MKTPRRVAACSRSASERPRPRTDRRFHFVCISRRAASPRHAGLLDCRPLASSGRPLRTLIVTAIFLASMFLASCHKTPPVVQPTIVTRVEVQEVKIPVPFKVEAPPELLSAVTPPLPVFVAPADPSASSALTAEGERMLRGLIEELLGRLEAWKKWATAK